MKFLVTPQNYSVGTVRATFSNEWIGNLGFRHVFIGLEKSSLYKNQDRSLELGWDPTKVNDRFKEDDVVTKDFTVPGFMICAIDEAHHEERKSFSFLGYFPPFKDCHTFNEKVLDRANHKLPNDMNLPSNDVKTQRHDSKLASIKEIKQEQERVIKTRIMADNNLILNNRIPIYGTR
ncbi:hypothetical protein [uncultured Shewanella sp.]|uniref:hypothetical protein n=1 Tax=uncultured Shewanella sp. TaxID=173975 RepID=UPI00261BA0F5|nr:hypothetical protein [uncultured Shewanella sp.]